jgi:membrane protease YdiL (CAAX protease family)
MQHSGRNFALVIVFESALGFVGLAIAWAAGISLQERMQVSGPAIVRGLAACLPMIVFLVVMSASRWAPLVQLRQQVEMLVRQLFGDSSWVELALICFAAGLGEELLFRGALQPWIAKFTHPTIAIVVVGLLFGLAHSLSVAYFVVATLIGCYFGWLMHAYDDLVAPITAHALYDFMAILFIRRNIRQSSDEPET